MENKELELARRIIANTDTHIFLTGKAGTGKTTFLRELRETLPKRMIVLAPTGIAAINAQGVTIHSFFQLNFGPQVPGAQRKGNKRYQFRKSKVKILRSIDLVVIDEISMVRADVLDAIDEVLRQYRDHNRPFGGVQMLMIGDMQQLAPVAKEDEWRLLAPYYETPYFFSSRALQNTDFVTVELKHVYRQSDVHFLEILNKVRTNTADDNTLAMLNKRYIPDFEPKKDEGYIRLTTHNYQADDINRRELDALNTPKHFFRAKVEGDFPEGSYPTAELLELKEGAQVMFIKNDSSMDKRYYNGMLGEVIGFNEESIGVRAIDTDEVIAVGMEKWQNTKYELNAETKEITEEVVGEFSQYPLKTAWAITVHKSQGLTFEHAIIDVQHSFAHGQTYVALSRCKTLEGMVLSAPIPRSAIINDQMVNRFANDPRHQQPDDQRMDMMQRQYMLRILEDLYSFTQVRYGFTDMIRLMREHFYSSHPKLYTAWNEASEKFKEVESVAALFHKQYYSMVLTLPDYQNSEQLQERIVKGAVYFRDQILYVGTLIQKTTLETNNKTVKERLDNIFTTMQDAYKQKVEVLGWVARNGVHIQDYLKSKAKIMLSVEDEKTTRTSRQKKKSMTDWAKEYIKKKNEVEGHVDFDDLPY